MSKIKLLLTVVVCLFLVNSVFAQDEKRDGFKPSYEVKLQILSASNKAGGKSGSFRRTFNDCQKIERKLFFRKLRIG